MIGLLTCVRDYMTNPIATVVGFERKIFAGGVTRKTDCDVLVFDLEKLDLGENLYSEKQVLEIVKAVLLDAPSPPATSRPRR